MENWMSLAVLQQALLPTVRGTSSTNSSDLGVTASTYTSFAEIMTGFSFAALAIYLAYESSPGRHSAETSTCRHTHGGASLSTKEGNEQINPIQVGADFPICRHQVAAALFFSMASLAVSSFLYASLSTQVEYASKVVAALLPYGVIFGTSVLAFFYSLTLMTYANSFTWLAAKAAYYVVVIAGPAVVLCFLVDAAQGAWYFRCTGGCSSEGWSPPLLGGTISVGGLLGVSLLISWRRVFEKRKRLFLICNMLCIRPVLPTAIIFSFAAVMAAISMLISKPVQYVPSSRFIWGSLLGGAALLAFFALACGCVVGPRLKNPPSAATEKVSEQAVERSPVSDGTRNS
jgi:hypothetical protein